MRTPTSATATAARPFDTWQRLRGAGGSRLAFADAQRGWRVTEDADGWVVYGTQTADGLDSGRL
jgi:hypothetical protein